MNENGFFHWHSWIKIKSVALIPVIEPDYDRMKSIQEIVDTTTISDSWIERETSRALGCNYVRTSVVKECECGELQEYIFDGDHTQTFKVSN